MWHLELPKCMIASSNTVTGYTAVHSSRKQGRGYLTILNTGGLFISRIINNF